MSRFMTSVFLATAPALLTGCPNLKPIAQSAPAATPPQIDSARGFHCWRNLSDCYARVVDARPETEPNAYNFRFFIKYHILNQLTVSVNGEEAIRTELAQPPSGGAYFFVSEPDTTVDGLATSQVVVYPRRAPPDSLRSHGQAGVIEFRERSINPDHAGTARESAVRRFPFTYADPGLCAIEELRPDPPEPDSNGTVTFHWQVRECKRVVTYHYQSYVGGGSSLGGAPVPRHLERMASGASQSFSGDPAFNVERRQHAYEIKAYDAMGTVRTMEATARIRKASSSSSSNTSPAPNPAACPGNQAPRAFSFCGTCTGQAAYGDMEGASTACTEGEARSALQSANPGCTFAAGQLQQFAFCKQCPNGGHGEDYAYACSESSARGHLTAGSPGCTFASGACR